MKLSDKTLAELIDHYIKQVDITNKIDYLDKKTVRANNKAVHTMYQIVELFNSKFGDEGIKSFAKLLDIKEKDTNLWVAAQLLERMRPNEMLRDKALSIIKGIIASNHPSATSFKIWLADWKNKS